MKHSLVVVDDFMPDPEAIRRDVLASVFKTEKGPDGFLYSGISRYRDERIFERLAAAMENQIVVRMAFWRLDLAGEIPHSFCHADDNIAHFAALLYINTPEQCHGGTAFWKHQNGETEMPSDEWLRDRDIDVDAFKQQMNADWKNPDCWEFHGFVGMAFNRCAIYPTARFHSRVPAEAFGTGPVDGRLVGVIFFDIAPRENPPVG